ncbi:MAG: hypothetical protein KDB07_12795, partial [Planctomycetes bacterium]|nr:hypothetical protein [Planctomycetota bacterium]
MVYDPGPAIFGTATALPSLQLASGATYVVSDGNWFPAGHPATHNIIYNSNYNWISGGGAIILDAANNIVDAAFFGTATPAAITAPQAIGSHWVGSVIPALPQDGSWKRVGANDTNTVADWDTTNTTHSMGVFNTGLFIAASNDWTGAVSQDWNNPANWADNEVPDMDSGALIPDAATTANDPVLPALAEIDGLTLESGAVLVGSAGAVLRVFGDFENTGGTIVSNGATIHMVGTSDQNMTTSGLNVGNLHIKNTMGKVIVLDTWAATNVGTITIDSGAVMRFQDLALNFSGNTFNSLGLIELGVTGGGMAMVTQTITSAGTNIGSVSIDVADAMDNVVFNDAAGVGAMTLVGQGVVTCNSSLEANGIVSFAQFGGTFSVANAVSGNGTWNFNQTAALTFNGSFATGSINYTGDGNVTINGDVSASGNVNLTPIGPLAVFTAQSLAVTGDITVNFMGTMAATINGAVSADDFIAMDGPFVAAGGLTANSVNYDSSDSVQFTGTSTVTSVNAAGSGALSFGSLTVGALTTSDSVALSMSGTLQVSGDVQAQSTTTMTVGVSFAA